MTATDVRGANLDTPGELIESFTTAVTTTLREMAGVEAVVRETFRAAGGEALADVSAALRLDADVERGVILSFPLRTAATLAGRVLAEVGGEPDEGMIRDCAAELLNVIAGQAKALLFGTPHHFTFSTPTVPAVGPAGESVVRFDSDAGPFALHLGPPPATAGAGGGGPSFTGSGG
jgi:CheY-specific phosphatase CheX